jgi:phytoene desaturase
MRDVAAKRAVVIGAGFGGIALAIRLQRAGVQTTLVEKRDKPGGRAYVWKEHGFTFDAGPTVITDPACLEELFDGTGSVLKDYVDLLPVDPFYRLCWEDGRSFDYNDDQEAMERQIAAFNPDDVKGYNDFHAYSEELYQEGYLKLGTVPFQSFWTMMAAAPQLMRLESWNSVHTMVARHVKDPQLRQAFSFHTLLVGGDPFKTSSVYGLIHALERRGGVWFARGGTGALIAGLCKFFTDLGGDLRLNAPVERITTEGERATGVVLEGGEVIPAEMVASNADVVHTYDRLLGRTPRGQSKAKSLKSKRFSMSLFVLHFGVSTPQPQLAHHTICFGARYRELISEIFSGPELPEDFSLYLHAPCATDPSMAPPGQSSHYVLSPVPHLGAADIDWSVKGPEYREKIIDYLEERYMPNLRRDLVTTRIWTPQDFKDDLNSHLGSAFSLEPILTQSAWFRPHNRDDVIPNLYIVGAGTHPGAGIPGVVGSAKATASLMLEQAETR